MMQRHFAIATLLVTATFFAVPSAQCAPTDSTDSVIVLTPMREWRGTTLVVELDSELLGVESPAVLVADLRTSGTASRYADAFASPKYARLYSPIDQKASGRARLESVEKWPRAVGQFLGILKCVALRVMPPVSAAD